MSYSPPITYSIINDIISKKVNINRLEVEINDSSIKTSSLTGINIIDYNLELNFNSLLSDSDKLILDIIVKYHNGLPLPAYDELGREQLRTDSRDPHDTTYFTSSGDSLTVVSSPVSIGEGDGVETVFYLPHMEVNNVKIYLDGQELSSDEFEVDYSYYDSNYNQALHFCRGKVTFSNPPNDQVDITATYNYCQIGNGDELVFSFGLETNQTQTKTLMFCDPVHIKDGVACYLNGSIDSIVSVNLIVFEGYPYMDNNNSYINTKTNEQYIAQEGGQTIMNYVNNVVLLGDVPMGTYFDVEARSSAMPPIMGVVVTVKNGSAVNFKCTARLEINRQRTMIF